MLITGGHGSGKTQMALSAALKYPRKIYIATAECTDDEMREKIASHRAERDASYRTVEEPLALAEAVAAAKDADIVIVDCLTVWVGNLMHHGADADGAVDKLCRALAQAKIDTVLVTNESGMGIIPADPMSRAYQRVLASVNRRIAAQADRVCMMVSGLPLWLKK